MTADSLMGFWLALPPEVRLGVLLPIVTVALGALLLRLCRDDADTARLAWPVVLLLAVLLALCALVFGVPGFALLTLAESSAAIRGSRLFEAAVAVWLLGAVALNLRTLAGLVRVMRQVQRRAEVAPQGIADMARALARRCGLQVPRVVLGGNVRPMCLGPLAPQVVLPGEADAWSPARLQAVLAHELVHAWRSDPLLLLWVELAAAWLWPIPGRMRVQRGWRGALEASCDAEALTLVAHPGDYASALLHEARSRRAPLWLALLGADDIGQRVRRAIAGVQRHDLDVGRVYWPVLATMLVTLPLVTLVARGVVEPPAPDPLRVVWLELPQSVIAGVDADPVAAQLPRATLISRRPDALDVMPRLPPSQVPGTAAYGAPRASPHAASLPPATGPPRSE